MGSGLFETVTVYQEQDLHLIPDIKSSIESGFFRQNPRGFGFWLWKPAVILDFLENRLPAGDCLVYADVGCSFNPLASVKQKLLDYEVKLRANGPLFLTLPTLDLHYSKQAVLDMYRELGVPHPDNLPQVSATLHFWQKDTASLNAAREWMEFSKFENHRLIREPDGLDENLSLLAHRHDQSVLTLVVNMMSLKTQLDDTYFPENWFSAEALASPFLQTRLKGSFSKSELKRHRLLWPIRFLELSTFRIFRDVKVMSARVRSTIRK